MKICYCFHFVGIVTLQFMCSDFLLAQRGTVSQSELKLARVVIAGHIDGRERLIRGKLQASGFFREPLRDGKPQDVQGEIDLYCAFDYSKGLYRFDRTEDNVVKTRSRKRMGGKLIQTPELVASRSLIAKSVTVQPPEDWYAKEIAPFDIRAVGSLNIDEHRNNYSFDRIFDDNEGFLTESSVIEAVQESENIVRISWVYGPDNSMKRSIWFDLQRGYTPHLMELRIRKVERPPGKRPRYIEPPVWSKDAVHTCETTWKEISNVWVPTSAKFRRQGQVYKEPFVPVDVLERFLSFEWSDVNGVLEKELFDVDTLSNDLIVVDHRLGDQPVIVKYPGIEEPELLKALNMVESADNPRPESHNRFLYLILLNTCIVVPILLIIIIRRRRAGK